VGSPLAPSFNEALAAVGLAGAASVPEPTVFVFVAGGMLVRRRRSGDRAMQRCAIAQLCSLDRR
jgi:hypothetical protein